MTKRIVVLHADGTERELPNPPAYNEMKAIIGGWIEFVKVLDHVTDDGDYIYTVMIVDEEGLLKNLPRNEKATVWYQKNIRAQYKDHAQPFLEADRRHKERMKKMGVTYVDGTPKSALEQNYRADPFVVGPAILFEGWTWDEVDHYYNHPDKE